MWPSRGNFHQNSGAYAQKVQRVNLAKFMLARGLRERVIQNDFEALELIFFTFSDECLRYLLLGFFISLGLDFWLCCSMVVQWFCVVQCF